MSAKGPVPRDDQWSGGDVRRVLTNIFHVCLGTITPHVWTTAVAKIIRAEGPEATIREVVRSFNEQVESIGQFDEAIDEDEYVSRFAAESNNAPTLLATSILNDLLPRAKKWSSPS